MKTTTEKARIYIDSLPRAQLAALAYDVLALLALVHDEENPTPVMDDEKECDSGADFHEMTGRILEDHDITIANIEAFKPSAAAASVGHGSMTIYSTRADKAGNCAHAFTYYDHQSGKNINGRVGAASTASLVVFHLQGGTWDPQAQGEPRPIAVSDSSDIPIRKFDRMVKDWPEMGCDPKEIAAKIRHAIRGAKP